MAIKLEIPPLGKQFTGEHEKHSHKVDHVWYMFFKRMYEYVLNLSTNTSGNFAPSALYGVVNTLTSTVSNLSNTANTISLVANTTSNKFNANVTNGPGGWEDLRAPSTALNPVGLVDAPTYDDALIGYKFQHTAIERVDILFQLPHGWKRGSNIHPHIHVRPTANTSGNIVWQLHTAWSNNLGVQPAFVLSNSNLVVTAIGGANIALKEYIHSLGNTAPPEGIRESSCVKYKLLRLGTSADDTFDDTVLLDEFDVHYYNEKSGTDIEYPV